MKSYTPDPVNWLNGIDHVMALHPEGEYVLKEDALKEIDLLKRRVSELLLLLEATHPLQLEDGQEPPTPPPVFLPPRV